MLKSEVWDVESPAHVSQVRADDVILALYVQAIVVDAHYPPELSM